MDPRISMLLSSLIVGVGVILMLVGLPQVVNPDPEAAPYTIGLVDIRVFLIPLGIVMMACGLGSFAYFQERAFGGGGNGSH